MFFVFSIGVMLWLGYEFLVGWWPVIVANELELAFALAILTLKLRYDGRDAVRS